MPSTLSCLQYKVIKQQMIRKFSIYTLFNHNKHAFIMVIMLFSQQLQAGSDVFIDFEATLGGDDNVTRAAEDIDIEHDGFLTLAGTGGYELYQGQSGILTGKILLEVNKFSRFDGLTNYVAAAKLNYTFGFSSSFGAPWFALDLDYGVVEFESFLRDSNVWRAAATMGMQIDDATSMRLGFAYKDREAESSVFTTRNASFFINLDWAVVKKHIVYVTYKIEVGDIFSSASNPSLWAIDASTAIVDDDVFIGKKTYRLDGTTQFATLGYNWVQDLHSSFDFSLRFLHSEAADVDLDYQGLTALASYFHRFNL